MSQQLQMQLITPFWRNSMLSASKVWQPSAFLLPYWQLFFSRLCWSLSSTWSPTFPVHLTSAMGFCFSASICTPSVGVCVLPMDLCSTEKSQQESGVNVRCTWILLGKQVGYDLHWIAKLTKGAGEFLTTETVFSDTSRMLYNKMLRQLFSSCHIIILP